VDDASAKAAADLSAVIDEVKRGSLRMFGDWFGRPQDNLQVVRSVRAAGRDVIVGFNDDEELTISDPVGWDFSRYMFLVRRASRVRWRWYSYGRPRVRENLFTIEHWVDEEGVVRARSDVDWYEPHFEPSATKPAAELL
jgi:hypothetical protein